MMTIRVERQTPGAGGERGEALFCSFSYEHIPLALSDVADEEV